LKAGVIAPDEIRFELHVIPREGVERRKLLVIQWNKVSKIVIPREGVESFSAWGSFADFGRKSL